MQTEEIFVKRGYCLMDEAVATVGALLFPESGPDVEKFGVWSGQEEPQFQSMLKPSIRRFGIDQREAKYEERQRLDWNRLPEKMPRQWGYELPYSLKDVGWGLLEPESDEYLERYLCGLRRAKVMKWFRDVLGNDELHPIIIDKIMDEVAVPGDIWRKSDGKWATILDEGRITFQITTSGYPFYDSRTVGGYLQIPTDELTALLTPVGAVKPASKEGNQGAQCLAGADLGQGEESKRDEKNRETKERHDEWERLAKESLKQKISDQARYVIKMSPEPKPKFETIRRVLTERQMNV